MVGSGRRLRKQTSLNVVEEGACLEIIISIINSLENTMESWRKCRLFSLISGEQIELKSKSYSCRFLAECHLSFLKPDDCHIFALHCASSLKVDKFPKGTITLHPNDITMSFDSEAETNRKTRKISQSLFGARSVRSSDSDNRREKAVKKELNSPALKRAFTVHGRPILQHMWNSSPNFELDLSLQKTVLIEKIAYCGIVSTNPQYFFICSRDNEGLKCRVFCCSQRKKAYKIQRNLSIRFERFYREWQSQFF